MTIRKRLQIEEPGLTFVTTTVVDWTPIFNVHPVAKQILLTLEGNIRQYKACLVAYVLMPSHIHMMIYLPEISFLSKFIQAFKSISSRRVKGICIKTYSHRFVKNGRFGLWKPRFDDFIINDKRQFHTKLDYIHNNPVRAGLVLQATDWPYSSASDWAGNKPGFLPIDKSICYL